ncbi:ATP-binding protein [Undibacterium sp.]|jgi:NadR type nicotinamide-nucleotide adenylyltransferase|uniref:ATP-binding protein n=1 Tax=Undibacterium sp. TaxID=1914977 RepID=UPI002BBA1683|nr:ATP-binding protein [Undibacterium sp.]HTD05025.1 ATP-binding protein [Undibacterium sp.]
MQLPTIKRVAILGAESSGKSSLAEQLAARYQTAWVPEYLREFVETHNRVPVEGDQLHIARTQVSREEEALLRARDFLFCDTTPLMTAIYSGFYFVQADPPLQELTRKHTYDFTIVTAPDLPWTPDGLQRESEAMRQLVHEELLRELHDRAIPYLLVSGDMQHRMSQVHAALAAIGWV